LAATPAHIRPRASYCSYLAHRALHSLPTRRSSDLLEGLRFPVVTKPVDMYDYRGLYVLNSPQEVRPYFGKASSFSRQKKILVEEYNEGYEFNLMVWVLERKVDIFGIADREQTSIGTRHIPISTRKI